MNNVPKMPDLRLPTPLSLRQASPSDQRAVLEQMRLFCEHFSYPFDESGRGRAVTEFLANTALGSIWLIEADHQPIGYLTLTYGFTFEWGGRDAFVDEFYLAASHRSRGLGKQVLASIQQQASTLGLFAIHLQTESYNTRARKLYESLGFTDLHRSTLTWPVPDPNM